MPELTIPFSQDLRIWLLDTMELPREEGTKEEKERGERGGGGGANYVKKL